MSFNILNISENVYVDESIEGIEYHTYSPYASNSFKNNDEVRIPIQTQNLITLPSQSYLLVEGQLLNDKGAVSKTLQFINNGILHCFDEIRYSLGSTVIDRVRNPGITCTLKGYPSFTENDCTRLTNAGWSHTEHPKILDSQGNFSVYIPLNMILGFMEDFQKIILNVHQELILIRSNTDLNAIHTNAEETPKIEIKKIAWRMPHVSVSDTEKLRLLKQMESNRDLSIAFRSWELHEYPLLQETQQHTWTVKTTNQLEKPRYIIFGFQTDRKNKTGRPASYFDPCNLSNFKAYLNSNIYPYDNLNLNFDSKKFTVLYEMFTKFQQSYYYKQKPEPCFSPSQFEHYAPLVVIDCSRQNETLKNGAVDIRLEFETSKNIASNTSAYCLIIHDRLVKYNPLTSTVKIL